jgi:hypothetical protein
VSAGTVSALDDLTDVKAGGSNFGESFIIGHQTTGSIGYEARQNSIMGIGAFQSVTTAARNSAVGYNAMQSMQSGNRNGPANVALGSSTLTSYTSQTNATAIGYQAAALVTAVGVTAVGAQSMGSTVGSASTVAIGYRAGLQARASTAVIIGAEALSGVSLGANAVAIGHQAMTSDVTGTSNLGIGTSVASALTSGTLNVAIGTDALDVLTSGGSNVAIGHGSGASLISGSGCVFLGYDAGATATASDVLAIDNSTIATPLVAGDFSTNVVTINGSLSITKGVRAGAAASATVVGNAIAVNAATCSAIHITSDNNGVTDVLTINNGVNGSILYVGFTSTASEQFQIEGTTFTPGANTVGLTLCRINGTWRVVSMASI